MDQVWGDNTTNNNTNNTTNNTTNSPNSSSAPSTKMNANHGPSNGSEKSGKRVTFDDDDVRKTSRRSPPSSSNASTPSTSGSEFHQKKLYEDITKVIETNMTNVKQEQHHLAKVFSSQMQTLYNFVLIICTISILMIVALVTTVIYYRDPLLRLLKSSLNALDTDHVATASAEVAKTAKQVEKVVRDAVSSKVPEVVEKIAETKSNSLPSVLQD